MAATIGERIRAARAKRGETLDDVAAASGVGRSYIHRIERGESNPTVEILTRLATALDIDIGTIASPRRR